MQGLRFLGVSLVAATLAASFPLAGDVPIDNLPAQLPAHAPAGLERVEYQPPGDSAEQVSLGRRLFFDPILSVDRSVACASCHRPEHGFADPRPLSVGVRDQRTKRNAPALLNRALGQAFMWDGAAASLEQQVLRPIANPLEMDLSLEQALARLAQHSTYAEEFRVAFGRGPDRESLAQALAAFVRRLWLGDSPVDRFRAGDRSALTDSELAGFWLYESRGGCWRCHVGANFSDEGFHNTGVGAVDGVALVGRAGVSGEASDRGAFKTPTLRGLTRSGPYMHDGSLAGLREVVEFYRGGGRANGHLSPLIQPLALSERDVDNLVAFLEALSRAGAPATDR
jgi:cytochrome c peroxidase